MMVTLLSSLHCAFARYLKPFQGLLGAVFLSAPLGAVGADASILFNVQWHDVQGPSHVTRLMIVNAEQWATFWEELRVNHARSARPSEAVPPVDFHRYAVVVVGTGEKPMGGFDIFIAKITDGVDAIRVSVVETVPGPACAGTAMNTAPFVGTLIPTSKKIVVFDTVTKVIECS